MIERERERERMSNSNKISSDWKDRETLQKIQLHIMTLVDFLNRFGTCIFFLIPPRRIFVERENSSHTSPLSKKNTDSSIQYRLADLEEKLVGLERAMSYVSLSFSHCSLPFIHTTRRSDSWKHQLNSQLPKRNEWI